ncbi:hypothetical protein [Parerythrobacter jejuensis]|uniref:Lipoprotein n=1 Tax=Parerythrobacter jejuensis TaxID=795812 RepID=A0A845AVE9_9SPHN|nr:hypothetical protein [Parerythrobacter jejuensis]MXP32466.1 hypothetical protein [Parerythrobacter jejuensis]
MTRLFVAASLMVLAACSEQGEPQSAQDFADRIGGVQGAAPAAQAQDTNGAQAPIANAAVQSVPAGADVKQLERLGDIGTVDLGQRDGGCVFQDVGREVLFTSGNIQGGKGVIRVGGELVVVDAAGGLDAIKAGTTFGADGVSISVAPIAGNATRSQANVVVTDAAGQTQNFSGEWICG